MALRHYWHVFADGAWIDPVCDHLTALWEADATFEEIVVGIVGESSARATVKAWLEGHLDMAYRSVEAERGFEQVTLDVLRGNLAVMDPTDAVLYTHTKGAADPNEWNTMWRRSMERRLVGQLDDAVAALGRYDAVGCHWLTPEEWSAPGVRHVTSPFFGGNYWLATVSYLRHLPPIGALRHDAEGWIGLANPKVLDLLPGWPSVELCQ